MTGLPRTANGHRHDGAKDTFKVEDVKQVRTTCRQE